MTVLLDTECLPPHPSHSLSSGSEESGLADSRRLPRTRAGLARRRISCFRLAGRNLPTRSFTINYAFLFELLLGSPDGVFPLFPVSAAINDAVNGIVAQVRMNSRDLRVE